MMSEGMVEVWRTDSDDDDDDEGIVVGVES